MINAAIALTSIAVALWFAAIGWYHFLTLTMKLGG